jgi:tRNA dimethylallyltransferase
MGPTASGKTALAVLAASRLPLEIVSADSRQVYRQLDIGTAKPTQDEQRAVPHHLIDILDPAETYNAARFAADALAAIEAIRARGKIPLVVGGAGFYLEVLREGLFEPPYRPHEVAAVRRELAGWTTAALRDELLRRDPERAAVIHANDRYRLSRALEICLAAGATVTELTAARVRPDRSFVEFRIEIDRAVLHERIAQRARAMVAEGWLEEVRRALDHGVQPTDPGLRSLGYPHVVAHLEGRMDLERVHELVARDTRRFARAQETWFRKARHATLLAADDPSAPATLAAMLERAFAGD